MQKAAIVCYDRNIDVKTVAKTKSNETDGQIATLFGDSLYYTDLDDQDGLECIENQAEFSNDPQHEIEMAVETWNKDARIVELSLRGCTYLKNLFAKHWQISTLMLGSGESATVKHMKINLVDGKKLICIRGRPYPFRQRALCDENLFKFERFGFLRRNASTSWQAASHLVRR